MSADPRAAFGSSGISSDEANCEQRARDERGEGILPAIFHDVTPEGKNVSVVNGVSGRRDWTRTNDPHHVKVVL